MRTRYTEDIQIEGNSMFTTLAVPTVRLTMSSRRRGEDMSLYDFAKKYQENQSSSELVKKQNASEDKVLSARLEYLNNQKVLTMKTLEKEIDLIKRRKMYGLDRSVSSHHFDRASLPNTPRRWTKDNFSPAKFVKRKTLPHPVSRKQQHRTTGRNVISDTTGNICERNTPPSREQKDNEETLVDNGDCHVVNVTEAVCSDIATLSTENITSEMILDSSEKSDENKPSVNPTLISKGIFLSNATLGRDNIRDKTNQAFPSWSRYSHKRLNLSKPKDMRRTPTPCPDEPEGNEQCQQCINGSSVNLNLRQIPSRFHHSDNIKLKLDNTKLNPLLDLGGGLKDLRFKNLESVLIPH